MSNSQFFTRFSDYFKEIDQHVLVSINSGWASSHLDVFMTLISERVLWITMALLWIGIALLWRQYNLAKHILIAAIALGLADVIAAQILKPYFARPRPCQLNEDMIRVVSGCAGFYGFPSNHATNGMVIAAVMAFFARYYTAIFCFFIAVMVGISRVYLGVHYPSDIIAGFIFGGIVGFTCPYFGRQLLTYLNETRRASR